MAEHVLGHGTCPGCQEAAARQIECVARLEGRNAALKWLVEKKDEELVRHTNGHDGTFAPACYFCRAVIAVALTEADYPDDAALSNTGVT